MIHVSIYNLSVALQTDERKLIDLIDNFISQFYTVKGQAFNANVGSADKQYVSKLSIQGVYYLHINQFRHLLHFLNHHQYKIDHAVREDKREYPVAEEPYQVREGWKLREEQLPVSSFITEDPKGSKMISLQTGKGKAQPLDARVKIPGGWMTMGAAQVGDLVTAKDGTPTAITGVFPQGVTATYGVVFSDGRRTEASGEHLWRVLTEKSRGDGTWLVVTTLELKLLLATPGLHNYVDLCDPEVGPDVVLPMVPYMFGRMVARGFQTTIPEVFLLASHRQRVKLLRGIIDTRGIVHPTERFVVYQTTNVPLREQVQYLVRSIGGIARFDPTDSNLYIYHRSADSLFSLCHKEHKDDRRCQYLKIVGVESVGEKETQCISIAHPDKLYVTDDFIVTHNTFVALYSLAQVKMRIAIVILPTYIDKWVMDIATIHKATAKDVMVIQGSKSLKGLISMAKEGTLTSKYFIFSSRTLQEYINNYELNPQESVEIYGIHPVDLLPLLQVGSLLVDETHQHFHAIYKILLHSNVKLQVGLSATLMSDDGVVSNVHKVVYPARTIYDAGGLDKYADVYALSYSVPPDFLRSVKTSNYGSKSYSHTAFEQSVTRFIPMLKFYCSLIDNTMRDFYIDKYEAGDKCLIFVATVKMATHLTERYTKMYPDKIVKRYCQEDPFEHIQEGEIIVTTVISAGTAIDIPNLRTVIQTVCISSSVSNIQTLGRLRKLADGKDTRFCYIYAENLVKQRQYHHKRIELFRDRVASHRSFKGRVSY